MANVTSATPMRIDSTGAIETATTFNIKKLVWNPDSNADVLTFTNTAGTTIFTLTATVASGPIQVENITLHGGVQIGGTMAGTLYIWEK